MNCKDTAQSGRVIGMSIEQALEELKKYADEFTQVGDATQAISTNKDDFLHKFAKVNQYYKYVVNNSEIMSDEWFMAVDIISDIATNNPSLEEWVEQMTKPAQEKTQIKSQDSFPIDTTTISGPIESLVSEVNNMQYWDSDHIEDIEWQLQAYQKRLISNQSSFEPNVYQSLMDDINATLNKIGRFNNMLNSEAMDGKKM